ncbi:hypothetical protein [Gracilibacillus massiliensis]|uniref:hypothetical protein n=1 Tax=Gracilibacillus massiliensis TaxID=1564956 RepID=UPI00071D1C21|nr:hypothetical protein [Gracilibacillus massiliensis]
MDFLRLVKNSEDLVDFLDIPEELRRRKVEVIILPYQDNLEIAETEKKSLRGALSKYKNEQLQVKENNAWSKAVEEKYENSRCKYHS